MRRDVPRSSRSSTTNLLVASGLVLAILGPLLVHRGYALRGDMVFTPSQPWKDAWLGLDGAVARFVPGDAVVWMLGLLLPGDVLQKAVLAGGMLAGALGMARLVAGLAGISRAAAMLVYLWNPWVFERLSIGQWPMVIGYYLLPWLVVVSVGLFRARTVRGWAALVMLLGLSAACAPASGLVAAAVSGVVLLLLRPGWRSGTAWAMATVTVNLPWIIPSLVATEPLTATDGQFGAFSARGESPLGTWASVLTLGGIWKSSIVPTERTVVAVVALSLVLSATALVFAVRARASEPVVATGLLSVGAGAVVVALLPSVTGVEALLEDVAARMPALGLLRDSHRFLGPAALVIAYGSAHMVEALRRRAGPGREAFGIAAGAVALLPAALLPSMAWGMTGDLDPVHYPREWSSLADQWPAGQADDGAVVVLPWHGSYRGFEWNDHRAMLDPAPRFFPGDVLIDDRHFLDDVVLGSEDDRLAGVARALEADDPAGELRAIGVRWVLVEKHNGRQVAPPGTVVHDGEWLRLVDLGAIENPAYEAPGTTARATVIAADVLAGGVLLVAFCAFTAASMYRVRHKREKVREEL